MRSFIYTYHEDRPAANGSTRKAINVYEIVKNRVVWVTYDDGRYIDEQQLVLRALIEAGKIPEDCFNRSLWTLSQDGIVHIERV